MRDQTDSRTLPLSLGVPGIEVKELFARPPKAVYEVFHGDKWLSTSLSVSPEAAIALVLRKCKRPGVNAYARALRAADLRAVRRDA